MQESDKNDDIVFNVYAQAIVANSRSIVAAFTCKPSD